MTGPVVPTPPAEVPTADVRWALLTEVRRHDYDTRDRRSRPDDPGWHGCSCGWEGYWCDWQPHVADHLTRMVAERVRAARDEALREAEAAIRTEPALVDAGRIGYWVGWADGRDVAIRIVAELREATP